MADCYLKINGENEGEKDGAIVNHRANLDGEEIEKKVVLSE